MSEDPSEEEQAEAWWNELSGYERRYWTKFIGENGRLTDAWAAWKDFIEDDQ